MTLEKISADIHALMTRDAAERLEQLVTGELLGADGARFAGKPTIETAARGKQRALVGGNRIQKGGCVGRASVRIAETLRHRRVGADLGNGFLRAWPHDCGQSALRLAFEGADIAFPGQTKIQRCV